MICSYFGFNETRLKSEEIEILRRVARCVLRTELFYVLFLKHEF